MKELVVFPHEEVGVKPISRNALSEGSWILSDLLDRLGCTLHPLVLKYAPSDRYAISVEVGDFVFRQIPYRRSRSVNAVLRLRTVTAGHSLNPFSQAMT
jgi:hypothetical protein